MLVYLLGCCYVIVSSIRCPMIVIRCLRSPPIARHCYNIQPLTMKPNHEMIAKAWHSTVCQQQKRFTLWRFYHSRADNKKAWSLHYCKGQFLRGYYNEQFIIIITACGIQYISSITHRNILYRLTIFKLNTSYPQEVRIFFHKLDIAPICVIYDDRWRLIELFN